MAPAPRFPIDFAVAAASIAGGASITAAWLRYCARARAAGFKPYCYAEFAARLRGERHNECANKKPPAPGDTAAQWQYDSTRGELSLAARAYVHVEADALKIAPHAATPLVFETAEGLNTLALGPSSTITTAALRWLLERNIDVLIFPDFGEPVTIHACIAVTPSAAKISAGRRLAQFRAIIERRPEIARAILLEKLRRHGANIKEATRFDPAIIEAKAAQTFWRQFGNRTCQVGPQIWGWNSRITRQPDGDYSAENARDPFNASLNYVHTVIISRLVRAIVERGFDPAFGFLHLATGGPQLAFDLIELLRAEAAERVFDFLGSRSFAASDFIANASARSDGGDNHMIIGVPVRRRLAHIARSIDAREPVNWLETVLTGERARRVYQRQKKR